MIEVRTHDKGVGFTVICVAKAAAGIGPHEFTTGVTLTLTAYKKTDGSAWSTHTIADSPAELGSTGVQEFDVTDAEADYDELLFILDSTGNHSQAIHSKSNDLIQKGSRAVVFGKAQTGTLSTTVFTTDLSESTNDHYNGRTLYWVSGNLKGQKASISDYTGTDGTVTVPAMTEAPANNDEFVIV